MSQPSISVCISAYTEDRWADLVAAVSSVARQIVPALEIIVVVDHNPVLLDRVRMHLPGVLAVENTEPVGLSGARNSGVRAARGEVVAFLDDDAIADEAWLSVLAAGYQDPEVVGVGGAIEPLWSAGQRPEWFPNEFDWVVGCTYRGMPEVTTPVRNLIGCNMSLRRDVLTAIGGFRSGIGRVGTTPVGCEETELCIRVQQRWPQSVLLYDPRARVQHIVPPWRTTWSYFRSRCYAEGLSKALVSGAVGASDGLSNERNYTLHTLPQGVKRGLTDAVSARDIAGLRRAAGIVAGLAVTTSGYIAGRARLSPRATRGKNLPGVEREITVST